MTDYYVAEPPSVAAPAPAAWQDAEGLTRPRTPRTRRYAMTPPAYFAVEYAINPWMDVSAPVDVQVAQAQWEDLYQTYLRLGHHVDLVEPVPGLPDMVYAANGGFIAHDIAIVARFRFPADQAVPLELDHVVVHLVVAVRLEVHLHHEHVPGGGHRFRGDRAAEHA